MRRAIGRPTGMTASVAVGALALFLVLGAEPGSGQDKSAKKTTLRVLVPAKNSRVLIDGTVKAKRVANSVEVEAPPLTEGKKEYVVTVTWRTNDYTRFYRKMKVAAKPGEKVVVDLRKQNPKDPDHIEIRFVPTPEDVVHRMCKLAKIGKDDVVYDLGCGDGRMVLVALDEYKAKRGVGIDLSLDRVRDSTENARRLKLTDKVQFRQGDVLKVNDLSDASVVMLYMGDDVNLRLRPILQKTLKPGSRIVSHRFGMGDWTPDKSETFDAEDGDEYTIHLWTIKGPTKGK